MQSFWLILQLAIKETRTSQSKLFFCILSIALGTMALTSIKTAIRSLNFSLALQTRNLMGADIQITSSRELTGNQTENLKADLLSRGGEMARLYEFNTMLRAPDGRTSLVWARSFDGSYPFYGEIQTRPPEAFARLRQERPFLLLDEKLALRLQLREGSQVTIGEMRFVVAGVFLKKAGSPASASSGFAPAVYFSARYLPETRLLGFGSRVRFSWLFQQPEEMDVEAWKDANFKEAMARGVEIQTYAETIASLQRFLVRLSYFISLIGLITLLLGGVGIGSTLAYFIRSRLSHIAVYRSLGASIGQIFQMYFLLAMLLGLMGAIPGTILGAIFPGLIVSFLRPLLAEGNVPFDFVVRFSWLSCLEGLLAGLLTVIVFTLIPIYRTRFIAPLRILNRSDSQESERNTLKDYIVYAIGLLLLAGFILLLTASQIKSARISLMFAGALGLALVAIGLFSSGLMRLIRRYQPSSYHLRQGLSNLFRPGNQTLNTLLALGAGVFLLTSIFIVESALNSEINWEENRNQPNAFIIDIQPEQKEEVEAMLGPASQILFAPMVSARLEALNGQKIQSDSVARSAVDREWDDQLRVREYFISYRSELIDGEELVAGTFWQGQPPKLEASVSEDWAERMGVDVGDIVSLNVQGRVLSAQITSLRRIRWQSMRPNAMIVLSPGMINRIPPMYVASFRIEDPAQIAELQDRIVGRFSNINMIDVTAVMGSAREIIEKVSLVVNFLAALALLNGILILTGAIASGRHARLREAMLLKVLGANRSDLNRILLTEFFALAFAGVCTGYFLAELLSRPVLSSFFQARYALPPLSLLLILLFLVLANTATGWLLSRDIMKTAPLRVLSAE